LNRRSWSGEILGRRYRVDEILGQGGMSAVYKAFDPNLKRVVAVKLIHPHLASDPKFLFRFEEEAAAVAQLRHPNIVKVFDFDHDGDLYYMVQEFVPGETLQERLRRLNREGRRLSLKETIQITAEMCDATGYAHELGMIHRDIKPANIMLNEEGQAVLMDFGIVKITSSQQHTATGAVVGTALYLPPEIIRGEAADPRSDIYSLGVTLYEMISGRPPFEANSAMTLLMMHLHDPVPDLRQLRPEVPNKFIAVIEKALAKDRSERYRSMGEMAVALRKLGDVQPAAPVDDATLVDEPGSTEPDLISLPPRREAEPPPGGQPAKPGPAGAEAEPVKPSPAARQLEARTPAAPVFRAAAGPEARAVPAAAPAGRAEPGVERGGAPSGSSGRPGAGTAGSSPSRPVPADRGFKIHPAVWIGAPLILLTMVLCGSFFVWQNFGVARDPGGVVSPEATEAVTAGVTGPVPATPTASETPLVFPTVVVPPGRTFARINSIRVEDNRYVVAYETFEYIESDRDRHVHFFFNTIPPQEAGLPAEVRWYVYGGPRPFQEYTLSERPPNAAGLCILVANADHTVQPDSGNCVQLPDVVAAASTRNGACFAGPSAEFPQAAPLTEGQVLVVRGISPDESWWNVVHPTEPTRDCWLSREHSIVNGDLSLLPLVNPPELPAAPAFSIEILNITVDSQNRYVVEYRTQGFMERLPGTHMHFFFNTVPADQIGIDGTGERLMHGGPAPFTGYRTTDRPEGATGLCVLVANPDHSVIPGSGNCWQLPDIP
jgi:serine/threonine protein kinase